MFHFFLDHGDWGGTRGRLDSFVKIAEYDLHKARFLINGKMELSWEEVRKRYPNYYDLEYLRDVEALLPGEKTFIPVGYDWGGSTSDDEVKRL